MSNNLKTATLSLPQGIIGHHISNTLQCTTACLFASLSHFVPFPPIPCHCALPGQHMCCTKTLSTTQHSLQALPVADFAGISVIAPPDFLRTLLYIFTRLLRPYCTESFIRTCFAWCSFFLLHFSHFFFTFRLMVFALWSHT